MNTQSRSNTIAIFFLAAMLAVSFVLGRNGDGSLTQTSSPPPQSTAPEGDAGGANWVAVYFTDPTLEAGRGGPADPLIEAIEGARLTLEVAAYDLTLWGVRDALIAAHRRGVTVRVVAETDNLDRSDFKELVAAGIPVVGDESEGLMHDKFVIIDRAEVFAGSMNFTINGAFKHDNNLLQLSDPQIAENYLVEFEEMFTDRKFGAGSPANTPNPVVTIEGVQVETYFSPDDAVLRRLLGLLGEAEESIYFLAFSFTSDPLAEAIIARAGDGLAVVGVLDRGQNENGPGADYGKFRAAGIDVFFDGNPDKLHHKVMIIDGKIVVTGSYNFTASAENRNDENLLIIHDPALAAQYLDEFARVFEIAER